MLPSSFSGQKPLSSPSPAFGLPQIHDASAIRTANRSAVLRAARWYGPLSRRQLAEIASLGSATTFSIVDELLEAGLLIEHGIGDSTGGRRPTLYRFNPKAFFAIGIVFSDMGRVRAVLTDLDGTVLARAESRIAVPTPSELLVETIVSFVDRLTNEGGTPRDAIGGVGIAMNGLIDIVNSVVVYDAYRTMRDVPLGKLATQALGLPTYVVNHAGAVALGENWCGAGRDLNTFVCFNIAVGVGVGMILGGELYTGPTHTPGGLGHFVVEEDGPRCVCGRHGCLQAVAGGQAVMKKALWGLRLGAKSLITDLVGGRLDEVSALVVAEAASRGDPFATHIVQEAGRYLGIAVAWVINLIHPQAVVIAGSLTRAGDVLLDAIRGAVDARADPDAAGTVPIMPAALGPDASPVGAAIVVLERQLTF
ncbi:MAG: ROK family protein [Anaerolineae bacterium]